MFDIRNLDGYPKDLKILLDGGVISTLEGIDYNHDSIISERVNYKCDDVRFLLRPLSDIVEPITHRGETFVPLDKLRERWEYIEYDTSAKQLCFYIGVDTHVDDPKGWVGEVGTFFTYPHFEGSLNENLPKWVWNMLQDMHFDVHDLGSVIEVLPFDYKLSPIDINSDEFFTKLDGFMPWLKNNVKSYTTFNQGLNKLFLKFFLEQKYNLDFEMGDADNGGEVSWSIIEHEKVIYRGSEPTSGQAVDGLLFKALEHVNLIKV